MKTSNIIILFLIPLTFILISCNNSDDKDYIEGSGNIESTNIILSSKATGDVKEIICSEGDQVNKGDTILIIDHDIQLIKLKQALAGRDAAKAKLNLAIKGAREEDISLAEEKLSQAEENFKLTKSNYNRMKNLLEEQAITKKQFDEVETAYKIANSNLNSAKENLKKIKNISRPEEISQLRSNYQNAEANVELLKKQISDSHITSPMNAFIVEQFVELGESINFGSSLVKLSDLSIVELVIYVNEQNLAKVKLGQKVDVITDTYTDKVYEGKVTFISPEAEFTPKNIQTKDERTKLVFAVKIKVPNKNFELKAGMPADAVVKIERLERLERLKD